MKDELLGPSATVQDKSVAAGPDVISPLSLNLNVTQGITMINTQASTRARAYVHNINYYSKPTAV